MDSSFLKLVFLSSVFFFSLFAPLVHSRRNVNLGTQPYPPGPPPPPPPPLLPPPPPSPPHWRPFPGRTPPPRRHPHAAVRSPPPPSQASKQKLNLGKKIGLIFAGIVAIMQVGVMAFLLIKRRQLLKNNDGFQKQ